MSRFPLFSRRWLGGRGDWPSSGAGADGGLAGSFLGPVDAFATPDRPAPGDADRGQFRRAVHTAPDADHLAATPGRWTDGWPGDGRAEPNPAEWPINGLVADRVGRPGVGDVTHDAWSLSLSGDVWQWTLLRSPRMSWGGRDPEVFAGRDWHTDQGPHPSHSADPRRAAGRRRTGDGGPATRAAADRLRSLRRAGPAAMGPPPPAACGPAPSNEPSRTANWPSP